MDAFKKVSNGISVTAVVDGDGCSGMVDGKDDGAGDGCVGDTVGAVDTIRVCPETTTEAQLDDLMRGEVYDEHLQKEIRAHQRPHDGTKRFCPFVDQIKAFVAFMLNPVAKGNMH